MTLDSFSVTAAPTVTASDLATFRPAPVAFGMEPRGWALVGAPANFFAPASTHEVAGSLLGQPAVVRFTPVAFRWDYGDGQGSSTRSGGGSWTASGRGEFAATPTSHVYTRPGSYAARLTIDYAAAYRFGAGVGFAPVVGTVTVPIGSIPVIAGSADTVLIDDDCRSAPGGPGC